MVHRPHNVIFTPEILQVLVAVRMLRGDKDAQNVGQLVSSTDTQANELTPRCRVKVKLSLSLTDY